jgi:dTDP-4-dehydrorhamnose reductase
MLGHKLCQTFAERFETTGTVRRLAPALAEIVGSAHIAEGVRVEQFETVERALADARPDVVVNCIGIVKQAEAAKDPIASIEVNSLFPHRLASACRAAGARLLHISTDCVFSGRDGDYSEDDVPDPVDLYGRSKLLGEIDGPGAATIRTSMIGRELATAYGLVEWFLAQDGQAVRGFSRARFTGLTTGALAAVLADLAEGGDPSDGIWHLAAEPISKLDLLGLLKDAYGLDVAIEPDDSVAVDRTLDGSRLAQATGVEVPKWGDMIAAMAADPTPYAELRRHAA